MSAIPPRTPTIVEEEAEQAEGEAVEEQQEDATVETNGNGTPKVRRKQVPKTPTLLSSLDLTPATVSLQDFAKAKNPTSVNDKYIVVATWFKEQLKTDEINIDHIFTAFRTLDWQTPDDLAAPFRTLKHSKQSTLHRRCQRTQLLRCQLSSEHQTKDRLLPHEK